MHRLLKYIFLIGFTLKSFSQDTIKYIVRENYGDFENLVNSAKNKSRNDYVDLINKRLENNDEQFIYGICDLIKQDSLIECIPNLKKYISNCKRKNHDSECSLYRLAQIGSEKDTEFILNDFQLHLNKKLNNLGWLKTYIFSLEKLNIPNSHNLLDKAFFDWTGINLNFAEFPKLFEIKKELENQYYLNFPKNLIEEGYKLNNVMVFIDNTIEVAKGLEKPKTRYIVEISLPYDIDPGIKGSATEEASLNKIQEILNIPKENINLEYKFGTYYLKQENRFGNSGLTVEYVDYLTKYPNAECSNFIQELKKRNFFTDYDLYYVEKNLSGKK
jgi:disulfide oxidoreductase YuzD